MKGKFVMAVLSAMLCVAFLATGCAPEAEPTTPTTPTSPTTPTTPTTPSQPSSEVFRLNCQTAFDVADPTYISIDRTIQRIITASGGRLDIKHFPADAIVPVAEEHQSADVGALDIAVSPMGYLKERANGAALIGSGTGTLTPVQFIYWLTWEGNDWCNTVLEQTVPGTHYVGMAQVDPPEVFAHSSKPINTLADLQGLKFRASGDGAEVLHNLGVSTVFFASAEIYESMQRGVIDAFESASIYINWGRNCQEIADYMYLSASRQPYDCNMVSVNKNVWNKLGPDLQQIIHDCVVAEQQTWYSENTLNEGIYLQKFVDYGVTVEFLPEEIENAVVEEAKKLHASRSAEDPLYGQILESMMEWRDICESQGIQ